MTYKEAIEMLKSEAHYLRSAPQGCSVNSQQRNDEKASKYEEIAKWIMRMNALEVENIKLTAALSRSAQPDMEEKHD